MQVHWKMKISVKLELFELEYKTHEKRHNKLNQSHVSAESFY